jgi:hypothetical protein
MKYLYVNNRGWREVPDDTPTVDHTTEHGDIVQVVEEETWKRMGRCQVKGCENEAIGFICDHEEGEHYICQGCVDKYYKTSWSTNHAPEMSSSYQKKFTLKSFIQFLYKELT